ncbi:MAG: hypothetical protein J6U54_14220 [Clostridiales bacterium]|nr:hypothetical protein [Clostridiales bacterium]
MIKVVVENGEIPQKEIDEYINRCNKKYPYCKEMHLKVVDDDFIDIEYIFDDVPIQRVRRITGYLVGTVDRWNDAKRAELADRVKHGRIE